MFSLNAAILFVLNYNVIWSGFIIFSIFVYQVRPIVEKVLYNLTNSPAVRITALKALVASGSDFSDIEKILGSLTQDINDDVGGYFSRFIRELANTTHYCMQDLYVKICENRTFNLYISRQSHNILRTLLLFCNTRRANNCKQLLEFVDEDDENGAIFGSNLWEYSTMLGKTLWTVYESWTIPCFLFWCCIHFNLSF